MSKRYLPNRPLPPYAFYPGQNIHPEKDGGHMFGKKIEVSSVDPKNIFNCDDFLYSIDLLNFHFPWEAHVWLEALWNKHQRKGAIANTLKALIMIAAAEVKIKLNQPTSALGHLQRAHELLNEIKNLEGSQFLGINIEFVLSQIAETLNNHATSLNTFHLTIELST